MQIKSAMSKETTNSQIELLEAVNEAAVILISQNEDSFENRMTKGVGLICDAVNLDRFSIWRNFTVSNGRHASQIYRWDKKAGGTTKPMPGLEDLVYSQVAPRWEKILASNEALNGPVKLMPEIEMLKFFDCVSALIVPLFIENNFWGFAFLEDRSKERYFNESEIKIMRSAASLCANIIIHSDTERSLIDADKFSNSLISTAPIAMAICDGEANVYDCNATAMEMFGCSKEYFVEHFYNLSPEFQPDGKNSRKKIEELMKGVLKEGKKTISWLHISFSGEQLPCEITFVPVEYKDETIVLCYIYDLRNMRKIEAIANEAQEMARAIAEASPVSYILFNESGQVIDCNETAVQTFASPDKNFLLENYWKIFTTSDQADGMWSFAKSKDIIKQTLNKGRQSFEWMHKTLGGESFPVENTLSPFIFRGNKFVISFKYDLRKQKKMMEDIRKQSEMLALKLEQQKVISEISKNFVSHTDSHTLVNEAINKLGKHINVSRIFIFCMDYEKNDTRAVYQWYADENVPELKSEREFSLFSIIQSLLPKEMPKGNIPAISCADVNAPAGEKFSVLKTANVVSFIGMPLYVEGSLWGVISAEHCFLPHEWSEDETSFFATVASIIAGAIMRSIYDTKLKENVKKVTNLSKAKDEFLSKISHEIRTPMNAILGITEIQLQDESLPIGTREGLSVIHNSGDSLLRIINDLLDLSKIEARKLEIVPSKYDIASLISDSTQLNMMRIESKAIEFKLNIDENIPTEFIGDELRIKQILNNVLSNAFKYTNSGEVSLSIFMKNSMLTFKVSDTGQGMTEEQTKKIFEEYFRFNIGTNHLVEGTGLGMTITRNLVYLMGGEIFVESEYGKGSTFTVSLPQQVVGTEVLGKEMVENLRKFRISASSQMKKMQIIRDSMPYGKVLVVDDVESNLYVAKRLLAPYDLSLETANSGFEAIEKIKSGKVYDIVFMDHMMPKMDGIETVKILRDFGYERTIVALTANAIVGQAQIFLEKGFDDFISKPIDVIQLDNVLNKFIRDKQSPEAIEEAQKQKSELAPTAHAIDAELLSIFAKDAKKSLLVLESTLKNIAKATDEDLSLFTVHAHAMKSNLANIGEKEASDLAFSLEKAGKKHDKGSIQAKAPQFIDTLQKMIKKIKEKTEKNIENASEKIEENTALLLEQLKTIGEACQNYDARTANLTLAELRKSQWASKTEEFLEKIAEHILRSDFEEIGALVDNYRSEKL
jgi:signal transduction histidine kinase/CheY-like chemotaxis protein/PAS domain-containing protein/HPt (histidine-containing phosphotransfer) domain-containing protein